MDNKIKELVRRLRHSGLNFPYIKGTHSSLCDEAADAIQNLAERIDGQHDWIPVCDGLPVEDVTVLITYGQGCVLLAHIYDGMWYESLPHGWPANEIENVLAWRMLPPPYKPPEEQEKGGETMKCKNCKFWKQGDFDKNHVGLDHICTNPRKKIKKGCTLLTCEDAGCRLGVRKEDSE